MGTVIDHLMSNYRVTVLQDFTDAHGQSVPKGATGVITSMELDLKAMEIAINWRRETGDQRLVFGLMATNGPRNNHMKEFFEMGEYVAPPRAPKPPPAPPPPPPLPPTVASYRGQQPDKEVCLEELTVACDCDPQFHRTIYPAGRLHVAACLRCGAVTVTRQVGDDGRFTGNAFTAYWTVPTPQPVVDWLSRFPRAAINYSGAAWRWPMAAILVRYPMLLYPADTRVETVEEIPALEDKLWSDQQPKTRAQRLRDACNAISTPTEWVSDDFAGFVAISRTLQLSSGADLDELRWLAHLRSSACEIAAELLFQRPDARETMFEWLASADDDAFSAGIAMLRDARPLFGGPDDPALYKPVLEILDALPLGPLANAPNRVESCSRFESLLVAIADLGAKSDAMLEGLAALRKKIGAKDPTVAEAIRIVINELNGVDNRPPNIASATPR